ncbi:MAG: hypothetical protein H6811_10375 [Phycisphaeraceae bacterium]|nr:hypothetical protein [Phycisphaeraceae bacterium]
MRRFADRTGFTLLEILVAVASALLLVLAIASLFASAGETVATGRRVSALSRQATIVERRIRDDLDRATREGFLIIRHEFANDGPPVRGGTLRPILVEAYAGDESPRLRRTDELMFFVRDAHKTARAPFSPGYASTGDVARVYYGQGARADAIQPAALRLPEYDMGLDRASLLEGGSLDELIGLLGEQGRPNAYATDWTLLRHLTVLREPSSVLRDLPDTWFGGPVNAQLAARLVDSDRQIDFQPAMPSVFRHVNLAESKAGIGAIGGAGSTLRSSSGYDRGDLFVQQSNLFDIATTDLREIRAYVTSMHDGPFTFDPIGGTGSMVPVFPQDLRDQRDLTDFKPRGYAPFIDAASDLAPGTPGEALVLGMHAWMRNALPTDAIGEDLDELRDIGGLRMRAEVSPPALLDVLDPGSPDHPTDAFQEADRASDQMMIASANLAAKCSEFMVEWSFGQVYRNTSDLTDPRNGETIWYGGSVLTDTDGDGVADEGRIVRYRSNGGATPGTPPLLVSTINGRYLQGEALGHLVDDRLIHGARTASVQEELAPTVSYFGYFDPTYRPQSSADLPSLAWPWPRLLRITFKLVDPQDPTVEQAFQFVYRLDPKDA